MANLKYTDILDGIATFESSTTASGATKVSTLTGKYYGIYQIDRANQTRVLGLDAEGKYLPRYKGFGLNSTVAADLANRIQVGTTNATALTTNEQRLVWLIWHTIEAVYQLYKFDARKWSTDVDIDGRRIALSNISPATAARANDALWDILCSITARCPAGGHKTGPTHLQTIKQLLGDPLDPNKAGPGAVGKYGPSVFRYMVTARYPIAPNNNGYGQLLGYTKRHSKGALKVSDPATESKADWSVSSLDIYQTLAKELTELNDTVGLFSAFEFGYKFINKLFRVDLATLNNVHGEQASEVAYDTRTLEGIYSYIPTIEMTKSTPGLPLYIGDLGFITPPTAIRYNAAGQSYAFEALRTSSNPIVPVSTQRPSISITLYLHGQDEVNNKLRPLLAMAKRTPFTQVRSGILYNMLVDRILAQELEDIEDKAQVPIPVIIDNVSFHTVPGYPDAVQVFLTLRFFNVFPYGMMYSYNPQTPDEISETVNYKINEVLRHSRAFNPISSAGETFVSADGSRVKLPKEQLPQSLTANLHDSPEFIHFYREQLADYTTPMSYVQLPAKWPAYIPDGAAQTTLTYNTITKLNSPFVDALEWVQGQKDEISRVTRIFDWLYTDPRGLKTYKNSSDPAAIKILFWEKLASLIDATHNLKEGVRLIRSEANRLVLDVLDSTDSQDFTSADYQLFAEELVNNPFVGIPTDEVQHTSTLHDVFEAAVGDKVENITTATYKRWLENLINRDSPILATVEDLLTVKVKALFGSTETAPRTVALTSQKTPGPTNTELASVLTSISISYGNKLVPIDILQYKTPTFQHTGMGQFGMSMIIQTNDPGMISTINDIRLTQAALSNPNEMGGGRDRITISDPLLNSFGLQYFSIRNTQIKTMTGAVGWYEIAIDTLHNPKTLHMAEDIKSLTTSAKAVVRRLTPLFFPAEIDIDHLRGPDGGVTQQLDAGRLSVVGTEGWVYADHEYLTTDYQFTIADSLVAVSPGQSDNDIQITKSLNAILEPIRSVLLDWSTVLVAGGATHFKDMIKIMAKRYMTFSAQSAVLWMAQHTSATLPDAKYIDLTDPEVSGVSTATAVALHVHRKTFMHTLFTNAQFNKQMKIAKQP